MKTMKTIHELALEAIVELNRRGWTTGTLGRTTVNEGFDPENNLITEEVSPEECEVCAVGAASSAFNNFDPFEPGYDRDAEHPEYQQFIKAVVDEMPDHWAKNFADPVIAVHSYNDSQSSVEPVIALFQRVADKHAPKEEATA